MYVDVDDVSDWLKLILSSAFIIMGIFFLGFGIYHIHTSIKQKSEVDSVKDKLEIENLELENKLLELQLKELGFNFTEESKQIVEE